MGNTSKSSSQHHHHHHQLRRSWNNTTRFVGTAKLVMIVMVVVILIVFLTTTTTSSATTATVLKLSSSGSLRKKSSTTTSNNNNDNNDNNDNVFSLMVTLDFTTQDDISQFLKDIAPVADYVRDNEPDTLAYKVLLSDKKDSLRVMVMERYKNKDVAYLQVHKSSTPFLTFRPKLQALQDGGRVKVTGNSYLDSTVGFGGDRT